MKMDDLKEMSKILNLIQTKSFEFNNSLISQREEATI